MMKIDAIIKIGGSVIKEKEKFLKICYEIHELKNEGYRIVIIPGGGVLVENIRKMYKKYNISEDIAHWMAIKAMDINGMFLCDINEEFIPVTTIKVCHKVLNDNKCPVFLPYYLLKKRDELKKSWDVTSDSISLYIGNILKVKHNILVKNVEGIYKNNDPCDIIKIINTRQLETLNQSICIDKYLLELILEYRKMVHIISGFHSGRIKKIFNKENVVETIITP